MNRNWVRNEYFSEFRLYIINQKDNADIIINFVEYENSLKCFFKIINKNLINKVIFEDNKIENYYFNDEKKIIIEINTDFYKNIKDIIQKIL